MLQPSPFDVAIIGGGVVGCAVARHLTLAGAKVVLLEKATDILSGASKGNSAILHTGFDAPPDSLELACMQEGYQEYIDIRTRLRLPILETGAVVVAWTDDEIGRLDQIEQTARDNGISDVRRLDRNALQAREPHLSADALGSLLVPREHLIDPWSAPLAYLLQALANGAEIRRSTELLSGQFDGRGWRLSTSTGELAATTVVNCAGLYGDIVDERLTGQTHFTIKPRKGQFVVFDKAAARLLGTIILPIPSERTKGIVLTPTIFGNLLVGPTAEEQDERDRAEVDMATLESLKQKAEAILPALAGMPVTAIYAGLRPATERKEYRVRHDTERHLITIGGIRSTGLTAALGLARHVGRLWASGHTHSPIADPAWPAVPMLAEHEDRDWTRPGYGEIICHCEMVTRREIEAALDGPLPAGDIGGLKRRTRAGMGCCQGFNCSARLASLTEGRFPVPLAVGHCHDRAGHD
ncbi:NAD(P)/FAD-dependent oxidoreductase [Bosea sp. 685]|uniref:NAD(P)/FAD-dependent oxidoreductase n=1 Tax=Bosea sp. 685 TaxID=3080057 RepID=UPI00289334E7|nr:NAD(P)/FAD-dependent oxidoreductase [Bosea sp. 685]WNJ91536.1 NAD(P)/FAD-dependent oxidoreductase [Bosea sp. 685]